MLKNFFNLLIKKPMLIVFIFIIIYFLPMGIIMPPEGIERQHIISIGLDVASEGVELSAVGYVPKKSKDNQENFILLSGKGENVVKVLDILGGQSGRRLAITHASVIVISKQIAENGVEKYLDYFFRNNDVRNDIYLICVDGKARELLDYETKKLNLTGAGLEEISNYNAKETFFLDTSLESFYRGFFSPVNSSIISFIELESDANEETNQTNESLSGISEGNDDESGKKGKKSIKNVEKIAIFKNGKLSTIISTDKILTLGFVKQNNQDTSIEIKNFSDELFDNVNLVFNLKFNNLVKTAKFINNKPVISFNIHSSLVMVQVVGQDYKQNYFKTDINYLSPKLKKRLENEYKRRFSDVLFELIDKKTDILGIYATLNNILGQSFIDWYNSLEDPEDFMRYVEYRMYVNPYLTK